MLLIKVGGGLADSSALRRIVNGEDAHAKVAVLARRDLDGTTQLGGSSEVGLRWRWSSLDVGVGGSDYDMEFFSVLADVGGFLVADWSAEESTFVVGGARRVGASIGGIN